MIKARSFASLFFEKVTGFYVLYLNSCFGVTGDKARVNAGKFACYCWFLQNF
jgi:hypothetical protein